MAIMADDVGVPDRAWLRRSTTIPTVFVTGVVLVVLAPVWLPILAAVDLARRPPRVALRCALFLTWFLWCEMLGLLGVLVVLASSRGRPEVATDRFYALQRLWSGAVFAGARRVFGFRVVVEGAEAAAATPMLLFMRHASMADTLLPAVLIGNVFGTRLRYVIKRELLLDPCLDVVGHRLPNYFVDRFSDDGAREIAAIRRLAEGLGPGGGVIIYPEGTRFTPEKRRRILARLEEAGNAEGLTRAIRLRAVLPPRLGGPLALLDAAPEADVVFCAHRGFDAAATFPSLWRGDLVGRTIRVYFWRVPRAQIPTDARDRATWLFEQWARIDAWLQPVEDAA